VFAQGGGSPIGQLQVLHGIHNFPGLRGRPSANRRQTFAYLGEVVGIDVVTITFDEDCLASTENVIVPGTHNRVMQLLTEEPSAELLGHFPSTEANTRTVKTLSAVYIPFKLVSVVLGRDVSTRRDNKLLVPAIIANGLAPLVVFHTQLIWRAWCVKQISTGQIRVIAAPAFCYGIDAFDMHTNLSWLPSVSNVPVIHALARTGRST
jgi:hypothetical protein